jgi:hypothetical protein
MDHDKEPHASGIDISVVRREFTELKESLESLKRQKQEWEHERAKLRQRIIEQTNR